MKGIKFAETRDAIMNAFDSGDFDMLLYERLGYDRPQVVADGPFKVVVTNVLHDFIRQGLDPILIAEVAAKRPMKTQVQDVYKNYAEVLVDDARRQYVDDNRAKALEIYGISNDVVIQEGGETKNEIKSGPKSGLQRAISNIPMLNYNSWVTRMVRMEGKVCRVEIGGIPNGTGFLVAPDLILTNYHVVEPEIGQVHGGSVVARFDYKSTMGGPSLGTPIPAADSNWLLASGMYTQEEQAGNPSGANPDETQLDFVLIRLSKAVGSLPLSPVLSDGYLRVCFDIPSVQPVLGVDMPLMIVQHPDAETLKIAIDTKSVIAVTPGNRRVRYRTNTEGGSSGSPVLNFDGHLVALHHLGHPAWPIGVVMPDGFNQGIPISSIYARLQALGLAALVSAPSPV